MIAIFRIRFDTNTDSTTVWSDTLFQNWMDTNILYSLGNFWKESSWGNYDLSYQLFSEIVITDPRIKSNSRQALVDGVIAAVTKKFSPDWTKFNIGFFWFAQTTDMFGGGTYTVTLNNGSTKSIFGTVADLDSPFDGVCQELGHSFGLNHELNSSGNEYGCPYSVMSARSSVEFLRPKVTNLPAGPIITINSDPYIGNDPERIIGPSLTPSQLYQNTSFKNTPHVFKISPTYFKTPVVTILYALDYAWAHNNVQLPVLAIVPPDQLFFPSFTIELRRKGDRYDQGIGGGNAPSGLVVHTFNPVNRISYLGGLPALATGPHNEWYCAEGNFSLRIVEVGLNTEHVAFTIYSGRGWVELDNNPNSIDIAADNTLLYQLHKKGNIFKYTGVPHTGWLELDNNGATVKIAASGGNLYQLHNTGRIWKYTGTPHTGWLELDNNPDSINIVADGGNLYQLHKTGRIFKYTGTPHTGWLELDNNGATVKIEASGGNLYQLHNTGRIWKYTGTPHTGWLELDNNPDSINIIADSGDLYQLHKTGRIFKYTGTPHTGWLELDNNPATIKIAANGGNLYQLHNKTGKIWKYTGIPHTGWVEFDDNADSVNIVASSENLYQMHNSGRIWSHAT